MIADGIVLVSEDSSEEEIRGNIRDALIKKFSLISANDFILSKVLQKKIATPEVSEGTEFGFRVIKKLAGQGTLYIMTTIQIKTTTRVQWPSHWIYLPQTFIQYALRQ